jgi:hypothetical protein
MSGVFWVEGSDALQPLETGAEHRVELHCPAGRAWAAGDHESDGHAGCEMDRDVEA